MEHATAYFFGAFLCFFAINLDKVKKLFFIGSFVFLYGSLLEIIHLGIPSRSFNPMDIAANGMGVVLCMMGGMIYLTYLKINKKQS